MTAMECALETRIETHDGDNYAKFVITFPDGATDDRFLMLREKGNLEEKAAQQADYWLWWVAKRTGRSPDMLLRAYQARYPDVPSIHLRTMCAAASRNPEAYDLQMIFEETIWIKKENSVEFFRDLKDEKVIFIDSRLWSRYVSKTVESDLVAWLVSQAEAGYWTHPVLAELTSIAVRRNVAVPFYEDLFKKVSIGETNEPDDEDLSTWPDRETVIHTAKTTLTGDDWTAIALPEILIA